MRARSAMKVLLPTPHIQLSRKAPQFQRSISGGMGLGSIGTCGVLIIPVLSGLDHSPRCQHVGRHDIVYPLFFVAKATSVRWNEKAEVTNNDKHGSHAHRLSGLEHSEAAYCGVFGRRQSPASLRAAVQYGRDQFELLSTAPPRDL